MDTDTATLFISLETTQGNVETISDVNSFSEKNYKLKLNAVGPYFATMGFFSLIYK